jgi:hypothetical protein
LAESRRPEFSHTGIEVREQFFEIGDDTDVLGGGSLSGLSRPVQQSSVARVWGRLWDGCLLQIRNPLI